eukprot:gnl/Hemi2/10449_TR3610_c0_g1_i1.p1 gnl/Hemi2/10449_TR3610_c0_g1~~gnl/Hemi2/10449_TR3610_c0_g1_i1.p1  ORF type:complete len:322 (+),score=118.24 gnl/Hemi2/10449_TR3610_c0_g1_i1:131-1096(+)
MYAYGSFLDYAPLRPSLSYSSGLGIWGRTPSALPDYWSRPSQSSSSNSNGTSNGSSSYSNGASQSNGYDYKSTTSSAAPPSPSGQSTSSVLSAASNYTTNSYAPSSSSSSYVPLATNYPPPSPSASSTYSTSSFASDYSTPSFSSTSTLGVGLLGGVWGQGWNPHLSSGVLGEKDAPCLVTPNVYLGSVDTALDVPSLRAHNVCAIVDCSANPLVPKHPFASYLTIEVDDAPVSNIFLYFETVASFIEQYRSQGAVLVHCQAGISRSSTLVIAWLMRCMNMTLKEAFATVKKSRPCVMPNPGFQRQLELYEYSLGRSATSY